MHSAQAAASSPDNNTTRFLWDRNQSWPQLVIERNGNDALLRSYTLGLDLLSQKAGSKTYWYHHDGLGSVSDVTGSTGTSLWWSQYYPHGLLRQAGFASGGNGAPAVQPFRFTGEQLDSFTGFYHLRARPYDPGIGRFLTTDPLAPPINDPYVASYVYVRNNPCMFIDPSGLAREDYGGWGWSSNDVRQFFESLFGSNNPFNPDYRDPLGTWHGFPFEGCKRGSLGVGIGLLVAGAGMDLAAALGTLSTAGWGAAGGVAGVISEPRPRSPAFN